MLCNGSNLTASANDLEWNGKKWSMVNHFIPFTEEEVGAPDRFESDFMVQYMRGKKFSKEAQAVLATGKALWQAYFSETDVHTVREELKLNRADVGWYQIRKAVTSLQSPGGQALHVPYERRLLPNSIIVQDSSALLFLQALLPEQTGKELSQIDLTIVTTRCSKAKLSFVPSAPHTLIDIRDCLREQ